MKSVKVAEVILQEERTSKSSGRPYKLTTFKDTDGIVYKDVYGDFHVGQDLNLEEKTDKFGNQKWEVQRENRGGFGGPRGKSPEENASIQKQTALKAAVELAIASEKEPTAERTIKIAEELFAWLQNKPETHDDSLDSLVNSEPSFEL
jgi:hypothetical protein